MGIFEAWSGWRRYRKLSPEWHNIVMYSESGQDWHYFEPLIEVLTNDLKKKTTYVTSDHTDPGLCREHPFFNSICIPKGLFLTQHFNMQKADVVVLTMMDLGNLQLKKSINPVHYIYLFHSLGSTHMVDHANSYDAYDSLFCAGPHHVAELRKRELIADLPGRNLFEYGHPRLEQLLEKSASYRHQADGEVLSPATPPTVLIAPTWGEDSIFNTCGEELTGLLLNAGFRVIVRPHYQTLLLTPEVMDKLQAKYGKHAGFEYQAHMGECETLLLSDVLICDWSAMAIEYAMGLEKPVLFIDLPRRVRNPAWQELEIEPLEVSVREQVGCVVSRRNLQDIPQEITNLLKVKQAHGRKMQELRKLTVFNIGNSVELGAREIARLAHKQARQRQTVS